MIHLEDKIKVFVQNKSSFLNVKRVNVNSIKFEEKVKLKCFHCKSYDYKWTCPPRINSFNFKKIFSEYKNAMVVYCKIPYKNNDEYSAVRISSTNLLHKTLLDIERLLYENNEVFAMSFIGGSCKLCKDGCDEKRCRMPHLSRIPLEATGINVIEFIKCELNHDIIFPLDGYMYRFGMILW